MTSDRTSDLTALLDGFRRLSAITDPIEFCVQFEKEQKQSRLRLGTFKSCWAAWESQQQDRGGEA